MINELFHLFNTPLSLLFLWSLLCFFLGMACCGILYHYYITAVIRKASRLIERLNRDDYCSYPKEK